jgi:chitin disaccharide deacetylase
VTDRFHHPPVVTGPARTVPNASPNTPGGVSLIVNADDFGLSAGVNRGIVEAHEKGIVTSASLMTRGPAAAEAAQLAGRYPALGLGLHIDLYEFAFRDGSWRPLYEVVSIDDEDEVRTEIHRQLVTFRTLVGRDPTHIDAHQHAHRAEPVRSIVLEVANELAVPVRLMTPEITYEGGFYGQDDEGRPTPELIDPRTLIRLIESFPPGVTELGCHPGYAGDLESTYAVERAQEVHSLCDADVRAAIERRNIRMISFGDLKQ